MNKWICVIICFLVGFLIYSLIKSYCNCKVVVEGTYSESNTGDGKTCLPCNASQCTAGKDSCKTGTKWYGTVKNSNTGKVGCNNDSTCDTSSKEMLCNPENCYRYPNPQYHTCDTTTTKKGSSILKYRIPDKSTLGCSGFEFSQSDCDKAWQPKNRSGGPIGTGILCKHKNLVCTESDQICECVDKDGLLISCTKLHNT